MKPRYKITETFIVPPKDDTSIAVSYVFADNLAHACSVASVHVDPFAVSVTIEQA